MANTRKFTDEERRERLYACQEKYRKANWPAIREQRRLKRASLRAAGLSPEWIYRLRHRFKLEPEKYMAMVEAQGGKCKICLVEEPRSTSKRLFVDHCHRTGVIRGLLCSNCNSALGHAKDQPAILRKMAEYLERA